MVLGEPLNRKLAALPAAALRHGHRRARGLALPLAADAALGRLVTDELPPDEERGRNDEDDDRDPGVQPKPQPLVRRIDAQQLLEEAPEAVVRDVQSEQRGRPDPEPRPDPEQDPDADQ